MPDMSWKSQNPWLTAAVAGDRDRVSNASRHPSNSALLWIERMWNSEYSCIRSFQFTCSLYLLGWVVANPLAWGPVMGPTLHESLKLQWLLIFISLFLSAQGYKGKFSFTWFDAGRYSWWQPSRVAEHRLHDLAWCRRHFSINTQRSIPWFPSRLFCFTKLKKLRRRRFVYKNEDGITFPRLIFY